jgi:Cof subfamily protein (haloacid dehalogenase superfamily)
MIKLIVCDMDGTLVCKDGQLPSDFALVLDAMREKGVLFAVASGRPYIALYDILNPYGEDIIYISENGAYTRYKNEIILKRTFDVDNIHYFASYFNCLEHGFLAACGLKCYYINRDNNELLDSLSSFKIRYNIVDDFTNINDDIFQLTVFFPDGVSTVADIPLYHMFKDKYEFAITHSHWIDIYLKEINKGVGLEAVYGYFNIKPEETSVFGDFYNDIPMFLKAQHSYCLACAPDDVRAYAKHLIDSECGKSVTKAIKEIISG